MAKNRDRRRDKKPEPKRDDPPPLRKARPDLLLRVYRHVHDDRTFARWQGWTAMQVAKAMGEHVDDVTDCLLHMIRIGEVVEQNGLYLVAPPKPPPPPPPKVRVNPALLLKVRKVFSRMATVKLEDFGGLDGVKECIDELCNTPQPMPYSYTPAWSRGLAKQPYRGNGVCPWCKGRTRRHARSEVHDPVACRLRMIQLIMET